MRRLSFISAILLLVIAGCDGIKVTKPMLRMIVSGSDKISTEPAYADSLGKRIGVPYVSDGTPAQVLDIYYADKAYLESLSPRTFISSYKGPLFVSTSRHDFIRGQALLLKQDCDSLGRKFEFLDIPSDDKKVGHVHNVINQDLPESKTVNNRMLEFMNDNLQ